ncbi:MAG TPA: diguanylate cyclase [Gemmataceae bacterium]|nr:diguanylate cyclase [Gemmataceae bacterium]
MGYKCTLLAVHEEDFLLHLLTSLLGQDFVILTAASPAQARALFAQHSVDIVLAAHQFTKSGNESESGSQFLDWVRLHHPTSVRILIAPRAETDAALEAINQGQAHRILLAPWQTDTLLQTIRQAARTVLLERSHEQLLEELRRLNLELEQRVQQRTGQLEEANRQLQYKNSILERMALTDALTGLPNRRAMDRLVRAELQRRARHPDHLALAIIDVDHFKDVNTRYLLPGGDHVLVWLAQTLSQALRTIDTVGRIGGEEFMVLAPGTNTEGALVLAERIRKRIEENETFYQQQPVRITVSVGVAVAPEDTSVNYDQLKLRASNALAEAKEAGRNRSVVQTLAVSG